MLRFFDSFPRFYQTSLTGKDAEWNNRRHIVLIQRCRPLIAGKRIIDFGSHDGRWGFSALKAGAHHVTLVEPEPRLNESARENFKLYGIPESQYCIVETDAMSFLMNGPAKDFDTSFLFGMLTVISEQPVLFGYLRKLSISSLIIDTHIVPNEPQPVFHPFIAKTQRGNSIIADRTYHNGSMVGLVPSLSALSMMMIHFGWTVRVLDWSDQQSHPDMQDYQIGRRVSLTGVLSPKSVA